MKENTRVLILEDLVTDAELIQFELQEAGLIFDAKWVMTENEYLQALHDYSPNLILSDYDLPRYNGAMALAEARRQCPDIPFILVTGAVGEDRAIEILTQGAKDYVLKNRLQRLVPAVQRALAEAEEQRARKRAEEALYQSYRDLELKIAERTQELHREIEKRQQIETELLKYNERLELSAYSSSLLLASEEPQKIVEELCLKVMEYLDCHTFFNFLVDETVGRLHLNACAGIPPETVREIEWLDFGVAVCGCVARDGCRIVAENIQDTPDIRTELIKSFGIKAYACHPILEHRRVLGTLSFGSRSRTTFSSDELTMMKAVTDQVAIAMVRVRAEGGIGKRELNVHRIPEADDTVQKAHGQQSGKLDEDLREGDDASPERIKTMIESIPDIILVEDNPADVELTLDALQENNLANRVKVLRDGEEAVNYIFETGPYQDSGLCANPKLILLDLNLPKIDGLEILRRVRSDERTRAIPVVVLTASLADCDRVESYNLGVNSYIVKPVAFDNFAHAVAQIGFYWALLNESPYRE